MIRKQASELRYFLNGQAFADGLRTTVTVLTPALIGSYLNDFETGLTISLGAMVASLTDAPGPFVHKKNGILACAAFALIIAIITPFARQTTITMGVLIAVLTFFFSMFNVYGARAAAVGNAALLVMILTMDKDIPPSGAVREGVLVCAGSMFYFLLTLLSYKILPYKVAQRALGENIREIANYLRIKSAFYHPETDLTTDYTRLLNQQILVNEKQELVRELFFKTRQLVKESTDESRKLVFTFVRTVDVFDEINTTYYDYARLREAYAHTGALELVAAAIDELADELDSMGIALQSGIPHKLFRNYDQMLIDLKSRLDEITATYKLRGRTINRILVNLRRIMAGIRDLQLYFEDKVGEGRTRLDHSHFVSHQSLDPKIMVDNIGLNSAVFRHSVRVCVACLVGYALSKSIHYGNHSYWILLTIAFIIKPAFSLTKQRNIQRIIGTVAGGAIGVLILVLIHNERVHFALMVLFMIGTYTFMRTRYLVMVLFTTPYILILFSFLGAGYRDVVTERVIDTVLGCAIAFGVSYFLFPHWESDLLKSHLKGIVKANADYLEQITVMLSGKQPDLLQYKLARKQVYVNSANLNAAFQRMLSEPKSKQRSEKQMHSFVVLNYLLSSNIATLATSLMSREPVASPKELQGLGQRALQNLTVTADRFDNPENAPSLPGKEIPKAELSNDDQMMREQLEFIQKLTMDIDKLIPKLI